MSKRDRLSGNEATAYAMKQINPDVVAAFPITPSTEIPQYFASYVDNGEVDTEFVAVESEHSSMSACIGAEAAGARAMTATSSNGLEYMWEMVQIASSLRLPIVMALVNRAISGPLNIHGDLSDAMAVKDGFITSHAIENIELEDTDKVKEFVGTYKPEHHLLDKENPIAVGPMDLQAYLTEHKRQQTESMKNAKQVILDVAKEFKEWTGREYGLFEEYKMEDADYVIVCMNSTAGTTKEVVDKLREEGVKAGLLKIRVYRPFPVDEIAESLKNAKAIAVLDKVPLLNATGGPVYEDVVSSMFTHGVNVPTINYSYGVGGRDVTAENIEKVYRDLQELKDMEDPFRFLDVKE